MENGTVPLRHGSLPGVLRLPKRYEQYVLNQPAAAWKRKSSIAPAHIETEEERMNDLMQAIIWVKRELILMRQHDVLLKRQFCDIQDTIHSLTRKSRAKHLPPNVTSTSNTSLQSNESMDFGMDNYSVRSASSVTALDEEDTDTEDDTFRPRTSSMKTTRDLAALARRRGSKELI